MAEKEGGSSKVTVQNNVKATGRLGGVTGRGFMPGQSGNPGGRPRNLVTYIRERTGDGRVLVDFLVGMFEGNPKVAGWRPRLKNRLEAACELLNRGWGRVPQGTAPALEIENAQKEVVAELKAEVRRLPDDLREALGAWLLRQRQERLAVQRAQVEEERRHLFPAPIGGLNGDGDANTAGHGGNPGRQGA